MTVIESAVSRVSTFVPDPVKEVLREEIAKYAWDWFFLHIDDVILTRKVFWFKVDVRVRDLRVVFEKLFGPKAG